MRTKIMLDLELHERVLLKRILRECIQSCELEAQEAEKRNEPEWAECMIDEKRLAENILEQLGDNNK